MLFSKVSPADEFFFWVSSKNGTDEDTSLKGDSPSSTETDSGVSEGCSDNGMSTEEEDIDNANGGIDTEGSLTSGMKKVEQTEDLLSNGLAQSMKVSVVSVGDKFKVICFFFFCILTD